MPRSLRQTSPSNQDIEEIWDYTARTFSVEQANAYIDLLAQAFRDIEEDPDRPPSRARPELGEQIRSFHIEHSRKRSGLKIKMPRHVVF